MAKISGIDVSIITKIAGKTISAISKIATKTRSQISNNWIDSGGGGGPTCEPIILGYSDGRRNPPESSCSSMFTTYDYNPSDGGLYIPGQCGVTYAPAGYYSDGRTIFFFDGVSLTPYSACGR